MTKKPKIGDIIEIPTGKGLAYAQYTHQHSRYGGLIRVFDAFFKSRPSDLSIVAAERVRFSTFFPVTAAVKRGIFAVVECQDIAPSNKQFPMFRDGISDPKTKRVATWWLWDGEKEWAVGNLSKEQREFPIRAIWNDTLLIERIETGWTPASDPT